MKDVKDSNRETHEKHEKEEEEFSEDGNENFRDFSAFRGSNLPDFDFNVLNSTPAISSNRRVIYDERQ